MIWQSNRRNKQKYLLNTDNDDPTTISINASSNQSPTQDNHIYFYSQIDSDTVLDLNKQIDETAKQMQIIQISLGLSDPPPIKLHINSRGGEVASALAASDKIASCVVPIHTYCEGEIASGATLMAVSGHKRFITKHSFFLIHELSAEFWGKLADFTDEMQNLSLMMDVIKQIYTNHTKIPNESLIDLLKHDLYITPEMCLEWGIVDEIIP
jgi:ATP-dependent protease ClpP protease subunit